MCASVFKLRHLILFPHYQREADAAARKIASDAAAAAAPAASRTNPQVSGSDIMEF